MQTAADLVVIVLSLDRGGTTSPETWTARLRHVISNGRRCSDGLVPNFYFVKVNLSKEVKK